MTSPAMVVFLCMTTHAQPRLCVSERRACSINYVLSGNVVPTMHFIVDDSNRKITDNVHIGPVHIGIYMYVVPVYNSNKCMTLSLQMRDKLYISGTGHRQFRTQVWTSARILWNIAMSRDEW